MRPKQLISLLLAAVPLSWAAPRGQIPLTYLGPASGSSPSLRLGTGAGEGGEAVEHVSASTVGYLSKWSSKVKNQFIEALRENEAEEW
jgi:hypothetical protein